MCLICTEKVIVANVMCGRGAVRGGGGGGGGGGGLSTILNNFSFLPHPHDKLITWLSAL